MSQLLKNNKRLVLELVLGSLLALACVYGYSVHNTNKKLSESLETAQTNIEAYLSIANNDLSASLVLQMTNEQLQNTNDSLLIELNKRINNKKVKQSSITSAATQTQVVDVRESKGVRGCIILTKDTIYTDSIKYNDLTKVYYTIGKDSIDIRLKLSNTQYLYTYKTREYKNKKSFFKRLFTFDFKKVTKYRYEIENTNDLLKTSDVRVIEIEQ